MTCKTCEYKDTNVCFECDDKLKLYRVKGSEVKATATWPKREFYENGAKITVFGTDRRINHV